MINYGHFHTYGHTTKEINGLFNIVQFPNFLSPYYDRMGSPQGSQFSVQLIDVDSRKIYIKRYSPNSTKDPEFTLDF